MIIRPRNPHQPSWHELDPSEVTEEELAGSVMSTVMDVEQRQAAIHEGHVRHAREYGGYTPSALAWDSTANISRPKTEATKNLIRSVCDTGTALISRTRPKATIVTDGAEFSLQERAKQMDRFLVGAYNRANLYTVAQRSFHDSTWSGTGAWKLIPRGDRVDVERVLIDDLIVDELECPTWPVPKNYYHRMRLQVDAVIRSYPDQKEKILAARGQGPLEWAGGRRLRPEEIIVVEAYHLADENGKGGKRIVVCNGAVLEEMDEWPEPWWPGVVVYWSPPITGFYGDGVAYRLLGRQMRINYLYRWIQRCQDLIAVPRVWVDAGAGPLRLQISNEVGEIIQTRSKPEFQTPQAVSAEVYQWLDSLERGGYEDEGISLASAANRLPPGIESAPAQREYSFKEGQRFAPVSQRWEEAVAQETAYKMLALYRRIALSGGKPKETWASRKLMEQIDWEAVDMDTTRYQIRIEASSLESLSPAGRLQAAIELSQTGWISPEEGRRLLGHPDLVRSDQLGTSAIDEAEWILERLLREENVPIDAYSDLAVVQETVTAGYRRAKISNAPEHVLEHVRRYLRALDAVMNPPQAPMLGMPGEILPGVAPPPPGELGGAQGMLQPAVAPAAAQGLGVPFSNVGGGGSDEGI